MISFSYLLLLPTQMKMNSKTQLRTIQITSGNSISWAVGTVLTQYCVSEWIWTSRAKEHHGSPILVVSLVLLWALYSLLFNYQYRQQVLGLTDISRSTKNCPSRPGIWRRLLQPVFFPGCGITSSSKEEHRGPGCGV